MPRVSKKMLTGKFSSLELDSVTIAFSKDKNKDDKCYDHNRAYNATQSWKNCYWPDDSSAQVVKEAAKLELSK